MPSKASLALLAALLFPVLTAAPAASMQPSEESLAQSAQPPRKHSILITYGDDACPESTDGEIVVCAQRPESERYRVPKELREEIRPPQVQERSWSNAVEDYDMSRNGRPDSCSASGTFGATGCTAAALRQWRAERRDQE